MAKHHHDGHHDGHHEGHHGKHHGHKAHHHGKHHRKDGGRAHMKVSGNPDVFAEAEDKHGTAKKHGGHVGKHKHHGKHHGKHHRATGGQVKQTGVSLGLMTGGGVRPRLDKPGRKAGGRVGADKSPLSSAHKGHSDGHETPASADTYGGTPP
jgi:hypothetical protein